MTCRTAFSAWGNRSTVQGKLPRPANPRLDMEMQDLRHVEQQ
jgi:hypothetical protein